MALYSAVAQCPQFPTSSIVGNGSTLCEGSSVTMSITGLNIPPGSTVDWYIGGAGTYNPYNGEGMLIGSVPVMTDPCSNPPEVLYIMVNPDNAQVGGSGDQCDEFMVLWTGSGGFNTSDIIVSNLGPGSFQWDSYVAGNAANFSCGVALPPGPVPPNAILIIQSSPNNNVFIDSDVLCASGLPVYIIAYDGTVACTGGYFDNNSPCSSCPVMIDINGATCQYSLDVDYMPPGGSVDGWGWSNMGTGVFADVVPPVDVPVFVPPGNLIDDFTWTVPANWCEMQGGGDYWIVGVLDPPPAGACMDIFTSFYGLSISCPELNLSGGGDVCEGNCPDAPTEMIFDIIGNDIPFEVDIVVSASLFPPFPINGLQVSNGQVIYVCLEGLFPSFDPSTGILNIPTLAIGLTATVTIVNAVSASGCPVTINQNSISLHFIAAPTADAGSDQTICASETVVLDGDIGGSASDAEWTSDGDGDFDDPSSPVTNYTPGPGDIANGSVDLTLTGTDVNGSCIPAESTITITIDPSLLIEVNTPLTICDNDVASIVAMVTGSNEPCSWETTGDGDFDDPLDPVTVYTPGPNDLLNGSVTLFFNPIDPSACLESSEPLELTIVAAPDVTIPQNLEICEGDSVVIAISIEGDYTTVNWSAPGDGMLVVDSEVEVTYTPGPGDINNQFFTVSVQIQSAFPECGQITYNIPVNIIMCDCPPLSSNPPVAPLCSLSAMLDLAGLLVEGDAGSWSITNAPPGSSPATISGNIFSTNMSDPGVYTVTYTLNNPEPGCPANTSENITVSGPYTPVAGTDISLCGPQSVVLNGSVTPTSNVPVLWTTLGDGTFTDNTLLSTTYIPGPLDSMSPGLYLVLTVLDPICGNVPDSVALLFFNSPFATFTDDTTIICNAAAYGSVLNFNSLIIGGDAAGTWTNTSGVPVNFSDPSSVDFDGIPAGYYAFQYQTNSAVPPCTEAVYTIIVSVEDCQCPLIMSQNVPGGICNTVASLPLNAFIIAGGPGTWQLISVPPGSNPATLAGSTLIINGCDQGDYRLRFTLDAAPIDACPDSAEIVVFIQAQPTISVTGDTSTCGQSVVSLNAVLGGSASGILWTTSGLGSFDNASSVNIIYTPSIEDVASAQVSLMATSIDTFGFCAVPADTVLVFIVTPPSTTFSALTEILCNNPDSGSVINLFSYIVQGDGTGFWTDADASMVNLSDPTHVDFDGVPPGNYRLIYTTQTALAPCTDSTYTFLVVVEDCTCPPISISNAGINMCQSDTTDLNDQIINAAPGNWVISNGPMGAPWPQINGTVLTTTGAGGGNYVLTYTLTDSIPGCQASVGIPLFVETLPVISIVDIGCDVAQTTYEVLIETDAASLTSDFGDVTTPGFQQFKIANIPVGQDIVLQVTSASNLCTSSLDVQAPDCNCTLFIEDIADTLILCPGDTFVLIPFVTGAQGLPFSTWVTPYGTKMRPTLPLYQEGEYIWIVKDSAGCEERDTFNVKLEGPMLQAYTIIPPSCPGKADGQISIDSINGGTPPYSIQLDNGSQVLVNQLPYVFNTVDVGNHVLTITDILGCVDTETIAVNDAGEGVLSLGPDVVIPKGDSVLIDPTIANINVATVLWDPDFPGKGIEPFWYAPDSTRLVTLMVTDSAGCKYQDQMLITVIGAELFYVPNVFSPNGDQINDIIEVSTNIPDGQLLSWEIFDRWGNMVYGQYDTFPFRWDGTFKSKAVQSGVYVYKLIWVNQYGHTKALTGNITVLR